MLFKKPISFKVIDIEALNVEDTEKDTVLEQMKYVSPKILSEAVVTLSAVSKAESKDAVSIAKAVLLPAHHPCIGKSAVSRIRLPSLVGDVTGNFLHLKRVLFLKSVEAVCSLLYNCPYSSLGSQV